MISWQGAEDWILPRRLVAALKRGPIESSISDRSGGWGWRK